MFIIQLLVDKQLRLLIDFLQRNEYVTMVMLLHLLSILIAAIVWS